MPFNLSDWELLWPRDIVASECGALLAAAESDIWEERRDLLIREAFTPRALRPIEHLSIAESKTLLGEVLWATSTLPSAHEHRSYFRERAGFADGQEIDEVQLRNDVLSLLQNLLSRGYFDQIIPYASRDTSGAAARAIDLELQRRVGQSSLWTVAPLGWSGPLFFDVVEAFHDFVSRPRLTWYDGQGWTFEDFNDSAGQALYRFWINGLFERSPFQYRLSASAEDLGRLVVAESDEEHEFFEEMSNRTDPSTAAEVRHAIASYRARDVTREQKRSAVLSLARILEERRTVLEEGLRSKDESALREIANKFDIRHRNSLQNDEYDDAYLDRMFRWYLATVKLSDRLIQRG